MDAALGLSGLLGVSLIFVLGASLIAERGRIGALPQNFFGPIPLVGITLISVAPVPFGWFFSFVLGRVADGVAELVLFIHCPPLLTSSPPFVQVLPSSRHVTEPFRFAG